MMTHIFMDESGDAGFKFGKGSSRFFVVVAIIFDDTLEIEKTSVSVKELKRRLAFPDDVEFKFNNSSKKVRIQFLKTISKRRFRIQYLVIDKGSLKSGKFKDGRNSFYSYAVKTLLKRIGDSIVDARIILDGSGDRIFKRNFSAYVRRELNQTDKKIIRHIKLIDSRDSMLIQVADMVAGSLRRSHEGSKKDKDEYRRIFNKHIEQEWEI